MQSRTSPPRDGLTDAQVEALLTGPRLDVTSGLELLDAADALVEDITADFVAAGSEIERNNTADVHGTCSLVLDRSDIPWSTRRLRPYLVLSDGSVEARFNLGVYLPKLPDRPIGKALTVTGADKLSLLQPSVGDTYVATATTPALEAAAAAISAAGAGSLIRFDGTAADKTLPRDMVWMLTDSSPATWLQVVNDILKSIAYRPLWVDQDGYFRSEPNVSAATAPIEWTFDLDDRSTNIVSEDRTWAQTGWDAPNWWRFVQRNRATQPTEGDGQYTVTNTTTGPFSTSVLGRTVKAPVVYVDAADQEALQAQGDQAVQEALQVAQTLELSTACLPLAGHFDVVAYKDAAFGSVKCQARSWVLPLDASLMRWVLEIV